VAKELRGGGCGNSNDNCSSTPDRSQRPAVRRYHEERTIPIAPSIKIVQQPPWLRRTRGAGELYIVSWNIRSCAFDRLLPALDALVTAGRRPVLLMQEILSISNNSTRERGEPLGPSATFAAWLRLNRYESAFAINACRARDGSDFTGTRGACVLAPIEFSPRPAFAGSAAVAQKHDQIDCAALELADFNLRMLSAYCHPTGLTVEHIVGFITKTVPPNSIVGGDWNTDLAGDPAAPDDERVALETIFDTLTEKDAMLIPPEEPSTAKRFIDGFIMRHNTKRTPCAGTAFPIEFSDKDSVTYSDHRPVMMGVRGIHKTHQIYVTAGFDVRRAKPRHVAKLNNKIQELLNADGGREREPHEILLEAARASLPTRTQRWLRTATERTPSYRESMLRIIRTNDNAKMFGLIAPRRQPKNKQPLIGADGKTLLTTDQEKADAAEAFVCDTLFSNNTATTPEFDWDEINKETDKDQDELRIAEVQFSQRKMRNDAANDKHGVPAALVKLVEPERLRLLLADTFRRAARGDFAETLKRPRVSMIDKPGKDPARLALKRPVTVVDQVLMTVDRVMDHRIALDCAKQPGAISPSQTSCNRNVPCDLQVHALVQLASNAIASGMKFFEAGDPDSARGDDNGRDPQRNDADAPDSKFPDLNSAIEALVPPQIIADFAPKDPAAGREKPPTLYRVKATRLVMIDMSNAYCTVSLAHTVNRMSRLPAMRKYIPYVWHLNHGRCLFVTEGAASSRGRLIYVGLGQGYPTSPRIFNVGTAEISEQCSRLVDFNSEYLDDTNMALIGRCALTRDGRTQKALNRLTELLDAAGLTASESKCKSLLITGGHKPHALTEGVKHFVVQGKKVTLVNPSARVVPPEPDQKSTTAEKIADAQGRTGRHLGIFLDQALTYSSQVTIRTLLAQKVLNSLIPFKFLPMELGYQIVMAKVVSVMAYGAESIYSRLSAASRKRMERVMHRAARFITGACKHCETALLMWAAGLPSFEYIVKKRAVRLDEKLIGMSPDFDPGTGAYTETPMTREHMKQPGLSSVQGMAKVLTSRWVGDDIDKTRAAELERKSFRGFAAGLDGSAERGEIFCRDAMLRQPIFTSPPAGRDNYPFARFDIRRVFFDLSLPGNLTAAEPDAKRKRRACLRKLRRHAEKYGPFDYDAATDGSADLEHYEGSCGAYGIWINGVPETVRDTRTKRITVIPPNYEAVFPAGAASCSYSAEGTSVTMLLRRLILLYDQKALIRRVPQHDPNQPIRVRIVLDGKSFADALAVGPLSQTEYLEIFAYELLAELQMRCNVDCYFVFVFAHVGVPRNEYVDGRCSEFMEESRNAEEMDDKKALEPVPMRLCDRVNVRLRGEWPYPEQTPCPFGRKDPANPRNLLCLRPIHHDPNIGLDRRDEIRRNHLLTMCAPSIGTVLHDANPEPCRQCGEYVMRRAAAVRHMFVCSAANAVELRTKLKLKLESVPDVQQARAVLEYMTLFEKDKTSDTSDTETDPIGGATTSASDSDSDSSDADASDPNNDGSHSA